MNIKTYTPDDGYINSNAISIFLAGPINGALTWREKFIEKLTNDLSEKEGRVILLNPQRSEAFKKSTDLNQNEYQWQIEWEKYHLNAADIIVFAIPEKEFEIADYARTTRFELGEWITKNNIVSKHSSVQDSDLNFPNILIWIDDSFAGKRYINYQVDVSQINSKISTFETLDKLGNFLCKLIRKHPENNDSGNMYSLEDNISIFIGKLKK